MLRNVKVALLGIALGTAPLMACASAPRGERIYVREAPPPDRYDDRRDSPGRDYVYLRGHWAYAGGGYAWVPGRWVLPERAHRRWVEGRWVRDRSGWYYIE